MRTSILILAIVTGACAAPPPPVEGSTEQHTRCDTCGFGEDGGNWIDPASEAATPVVQALLDYAGQPVDHMTYCIGNDRFVHCCSKQVENGSAGACCGVNYARNIVGCWVTLNIFDYLVVN